MKIKGTLAARWFMFSLYYFFVGSVRKCGGKETLVRRRMIKAVFLDVGGTLIRPFPSVGGIYANVAAQHGVSLSPETVDQRFKIAWKAKRATRRPVEKSWWREVVAEVFVGHAFPDFESFFEDVYAAFATKTAWHIFDDVIPALEALKAQSKRIAVLSNWDARLPTLLQTLGLDRYFDRQFISFGMGLVKPDPLFFKRALEQMELHPTEAIHIGDDVEEDVKGAESAGIRAYLLDRDARPINSRMMRSLEEIHVRI
jgi:putative hydrolase of the HAD superfamily